MNNDGISQVERMMIQSFVKPRTMKQGARLRMRLLPCDN